MADILRFETINVDHAPKQCAAIVTNNVLRISLLMCGGLIMYKLGVLSLNVIDRAIARHYD